MMHELLSISVCHCKRWGRSLYAYTDCRLMECGTPPWWWMASSTSMEEVCNKLWLGPLHMASRWTLYTLGTTLAVLLSEVLH